MAQNKLGTGSMRAPSRRFPWQNALFAWAIVITVIIAAISTGVVAALSQTVWKSPARPVPQPQRVIALAPVVPTPAPTATPTPTPKEWPKLTVIWQEIPPTPGVYLHNFIEGEEFLYRGSMAVPEVGGKTFRPTLEGNAFIEKVLPQLKGIGGMVAAARDSTDKSIVFASISAGDYSENGRPKYYVHLLLSADGEKSWHEINLPAMGQYYEYDPNGNKGQATHGPGAVRVRVESDSILLVVQDNTVQEKWWTTTIKRSELQAP